MPLFHSKTLFSWEKHHLHNFAKTFGGQLRSFCETSQLLRPLHWIEPCQALSAKVLQIHFFAGHLNNNTKRKITQTMPINILQSKSLVPINLLDDSYVTSSMMICLPELKTASVSHGHRKSLWIRIHSMFWPCHDQSHFRSSFEWMYQGCIMNASEMYHRSNILTERPWAIFIESQKTCVGR